ncbi:MAG: M20 family metallopeptidase [Desulfobulbaceae bacterium]|nr:M20 family metallopeptidase [Desulfobulbaceae bacterium]
MNVLPDQVLIDRMREIRRALHSLPELAYQEKRTAALVADELSRLGISHRTGVGGTGIVAELGGESGGASQQQPCVALRADMDAIPLDEETNLPFASTNPGAMHACGHDGHMAMLLGAAALLQQEDLPGRVVLLFQPAEESGNGAEKLIFEGALDGVQMIFAGHIDIHFPVGTFTVDQGLICSYTDPFTITIHGRGGHAAWPHETIDSVVVASNLIMNMQTLVSREIDPVYPAVVTVGRVSAGTVHNVIAERAVIDGTVRSAHPETRRRILNGLTRMIQGVSSMSGAQVTLQLLDGLPAVINESTATEIARRAVEELVGPDGVLSQGRPSLGGEDFAFYLSRVPGCMVRFGARKEAEKTGLAHSSRFDFDEDVLQHGSAWLARVALRGLQHLIEKPAP